MTTTTQQSTQGNTAPDVNPTLKAIKNGLQTIGTVPTDEGHSGSYPVGAFGFANMPMAWRGCVQNSYGIFVFNDDGTISHLPFNLMVLSNSTLRGCQFIPTHSYEWGKVAITCWSLVSSSHDVNDAPCLNELSRLLKYLTPNHLKALKSLLSNGLKVVQMECEKREYGGVDTECPILSPHYLPSSYGGRVIVEDVWIESQPKSGSYALTYGLEEYLGQLTDLSIGYEIEHDQIYRLDLTSTTLHQNGCVISIHSEDGEPFGYEQFSLQQLPKRLPEAVSLARELVGIIRPEDQDLATHLMLGQVGRPYTDLTGCENDGYYWAYDLYRSQAEKPLKPLHEICKERGLDWYPQPW